MAEENDTIEHNRQSLDNLHLNDKQECTAAEHKLDQGSSQTSLLREKPPNIILCDAWYGFPSQKRPRKERICAVSRQLVNFLTWRLEYKPNFPRNAYDCQVHLLGKDLDVRAVRDRIHDIVAEKFTTSSREYDNEIIFKPNVDVCEATQQVKNECKDENFEVVYLSPDASDTLSLLSPPPPVVIVGMLIDRRITSDRSRKRAEESLNMRAVKLPLNELNAREISSEEPLNVDTVMEIMQRWWFNCDKLENQLFARDDQGEVVKNDACEDEYKKCFIDAASWALKSHRERHPNRTVHKT
ncbi:hypothetical protein HJC23_010613 [Cyclotella cryptica]|uniref:tRNA (guanine(9)-N(1))-methyltransferase n=1 Tax=Cyclotella cryptica TaxID=29204 RepID=A0ABD3PPI8_9STRA|eukprot:CCRYP_012800-RA/>CCRYP_012800-RA protein AED:0.04 eAED:-0.01 QI:0/-1/0/1/-1/1/1/0/297